MTTTELLIELRRCGVELVAAGERLRYRPRGAVGPNLLDELRRHKREILLQFWIEALSPDWRAEFEERAAIRQYDGGQCREAAELDAIHEIRARMRAAAEHS